MSLLPVLLLTLISLVLPLTALSNNQVSLDRVSLQLNANHQFRFAGYYMAVEKGFYKDKGIEVEIKPATATIDSVNELISMKSNYAISGADALIAKARKLPIVALAAVNHESPLALVTRKDINKLSELKGKRIMFNETNKFAIVSMLKTANITPNDIINLPFTSSHKALDDNLTDAYPTYITDSTYLNDLDRKKYNYFRPKNYGLSFYNDILITTNGETFNHRFRVRDFTEASLQGWEYALNNIDETVDVILKKYPNPLLTKLKLSQEAVALSQLIRPLETEIGLMKDDYWQLILDNFKKFNLIPNNSRLDDFVYTAEDDYLLDYLNLSAKERIWLRKNWNQIRLGVSLDWFPIEFANQDENHAGISSDLIKRIGKDLKIFIKSAKGVSQAEAINKIRNNEIDVLPASIKTKAMEEYLLFSNPYMNSDWVVISKNDELELDLTENIDDMILYSLAPIKKEKIAVTKGYVAHQRLLENHYTFDIIVRSNVLETLQAVSSGDARFAIVDLETAAPLIHSYQMTDLKVNTPAFDVQDGIHFAVRKDWPELVSIINKELDYIGQTEIDRIKNKWRSVPVSLGIEKQDVFIIIAVGMLIIVIIGIWAFTIRRAKTKVEVLLQKETDLLVTNSRHIVMGEMISMLVHQWKQPLTSMMLGISIIKMKLNSIETKEEDKQFLDKQFAKVEDMLDEQNKLISDLRNFFHPDKNKESFNLLACVNGALSMLDGVIHKNSIDIKLDIDSSIELLGFERELKHVFINLIKNAVDELVESNIQSPLISLRSASTNNDIMIEIQDNGNGIPGELLPTIFEAYVSTKALNGTGLGLYMGKLVVEEHFSGTISVRNCSEFNPCSHGLSGACFTILIPITQD